MSEKWPWIALAVLCAIALISLGMVAGLYASIEAVSLGGVN